jgi:hypothetical protein
VDSLSAALVSTAQGLQHSAQQQQLSLAVLKTAMNVQAASAAALIQALPQPQLASTGSLGTQLNVYA